MADLRREHPGREVELWCEDEARLGLKPIVWRVWALKGRQPTSNGRHKFESVFVYGFAHPKTGRRRFSILPKTNGECMGQGTHLVKTVCGFRGDEHGSVQATTVAA